jgi:8-oxo-dGTP pyrophosphatase MutT (NUDIX family)
MMEDAQHMNVGERSCVVISKIVTAGVFVNINGYFPFQVGPSKSGTTLGVVRLGGHRENGETGWQCASRETFEEASIAITRMKPPATYWYEASDYLTLSIGNWEEDDEPPILVGKRIESDFITPIYLARSSETPVPAMETKGILLLRPEEIKTINSKPMTLGEYLETGGKAVFREDLPHDLVLEPYPHLRLLEILIDMHPEIAR